MRCAQKQFAFFCKSLSIFDSETLRLILGCPTAKWLVSDARNALISCPEVVRVTVQKVLEANIYACCCVCQQRYIPANTKHLYNICTMSAQRFRRWSNIVQMSCKCFVFAGILLELPRGLTSASICNVSTQLN